MLTASLVNKYFPDATDGVSWVRGGASAARYAKRYDRSL